MNFAAGVAVGVVATFIFTFLFFRNNAKKVARVATVVGDRTANTEQKINQVREIIGV